MTTQEREAAGRGGPLPLAIQKAIGADGAEHRIGGWRDAHGLLNDVAESEALVAFAAREKCGGASMTIDDAAA